MYIVHSEYNCLDITVDIAIYYYDYYAFSNLAHARFLKYQTTKLQLFY